jgi:hypothetical protein
MSECVRSAVEAATASLAARFGFDCDAGLAHLRKKRLLRAPCPNLPSELVQKVLGFLTKSELIGGRVWLVSRDFAAAVSTARDWSELVVCCEEEREGGDVLSSRSVALLPRSVAATVESVALVSSTAAMAHPRFRAMRLPALRRVAVSWGLDADDCVRADTLAASMVPLLSTRELEVAFEVEGGEEYFECVADLVRRRCFPRLARILNGGSRARASHVALFADLFGTNWLLGEEDRELCCLETRSTFASLSAGDPLMHFVEPHFQFWDLAQNRPDEFVVIARLGYDNFPRFRALRPHGGFPNLEVLVIEESAISLNDFQSLFVHFAEQTPRLKTLAISTDSAGYRSSGIEWEASFRELSPSVTQLFLEFDSCSIDDERIQLGNSGQIQAAAAANKYLDLICPNLAPCATCHIHTCPFAGYREKTMYPQIKDVVKGVPTAGVFVSRQGSRT